jgi:speckle-type POZ protein
MANNRPSDSSSVDNDHQMLPETWSTCRTQAITGAHNFVVTDFSPLDVMGPGDYVSSGTFFVGGCEWSIQFYPGGEGAQDDDKPAAYTTVRLNLLDGPPGVRVKFSISLLFDEDSQAPSSGKKGKRKKKGSAGQGDKQVAIIARTLFTDTRTYDTEHSNNWGWSDFIEKSKLRELPHGFTIRCAVTVVKHRTEDAATVVAPPSDLHRDFARMLEAADGADVTISVGDRFFLAHRYVLAARSRVFRAQLFGVMEESATGCVRIEDMEPSVFERLLRFVYTDSLPESSYEERDDETVAMQHLLVAADRYELKRLGLMCEAKLSSWIDVRSVAAILGLADRHQRVHLKEACLRFIAWPEMLGAVLQTEGFKDLIASCPLIMKEILDKIASAKLDLA